MDTTPPPCPAPALVSHARLGWGLASAAHFRLCSQLGPAKQLMCLFFSEPEQIPGKGPGEREGVVRNPWPWASCPGWGRVLCPHRASSAKAASHPGVGEGVAAGLSPSCATSSLRRAGAVVRPDVCHVVWPSSPALVKAGGGHGLESSAGFPGLENGESAWLHQQPGVLDLAPGRSRRPVLHPPCSRCPQKSL